jgi:hypothetical protein
MCWTLCVKKNLTKSPLLITEEDAFKVWVIFNFLSEDKYPLIIVPEEVSFCGFGELLQGCLNIEYTGLEVFVLIYYQHGRRFLISVLRSEAKQLGSRKMQT